LSSVWKLAFSVSQGSRSGVLRIWVTCERSRDMVAVSMFGMARAAMYSSSSAWISYGSLTRSTDSPVTTAPWCGLTVMSPSA
jgi:hypothetical protein